ncbi:hypothetical protein ATG98_3509 [Marinobacter sp. LV10R520-4]|jgi:hypothetical protein|nr:hypothetical protein ATG98_3509 [Marinobacter sp. LV10R520-4]
MSTGSDVRLPKTDHYAVNTAKNYLNFLQKLLGLTGVQNSLRLPNK